MPRPLRFLLRAVALTIACLLGYFVWKNPETTTLDAKAREGASGQFASLSQGVTHYEVAGPDTGRVVLLVHGFSVPYYIWDSTFTALQRAGFRVIRYDVLGRGLSDRPDVAYDGATYDRQIDDLLDALKVTQPIDLMGLSFGGFVTAHYAKTHPKRLRTLTLVDPAASKGDALPALMTTPVIGPFFWQTLAVPGMADNQPTDFLHPERFPGWADRYRPQMKYKGFGRALLRSAITLRQTDIDALYAGAAGIPTLLVWGRQDPTVPFALSSVVTRNIPGIEFFPVDSSGHLPNLEQAPLVHARMLAFLAAHPVK